MEIHRVIYAGNPHLPYLVAQDFICNAGNAAANNLPETAACSTVPSNGYNLYTHTNRTTGPTGAALTHIQACPVQILTASFEFSGNRENPKPSANNCYDGHNNATDFTWGHGPGIDRRNREASLGQQLEDGWQTVENAVPDVILKNVPGMAAATPITLLNANLLTERVFKSEYVAHSRPCLIKNAVSHWPASREWRDREYLKSVCGRQEVPFWPHENHVTRERIAPGVESLPFADAIDRLHNAGHGAVAAIGCVPGTAKMAADLGGFSFFTEAELAFSYSQYRFFIFRNAGSTWHYHPMDETLMCQVIGTKRVGLLNVDNPHHGCLSRIFSAEDYYEDPSAFDELEGKTLQWFYADLEEGDALYIPPLWWHGVIATRDVVGVTTPVSWRSPPHVIAASLRKMAAGNFELMGAFNISQFRQLLDTAQKLGLEHELKIAWNRGVTNQNISLMDQSGVRMRQTPNFPPI